jgi:hypothetical protein
LQIARRFYEHVGGHGDGKQAAERLFARIGRGRMVAVRTRIVLAAANS